MNRRAGLWVLTIALVAAALAIVTLDKRGVVVTGGEAIEARIARVEAGLRPAVRVKGWPEPAWTLSERMEHYHVPGASVAVLNNGRIEWARGYGVLEWDGATVTPGTLFQAASISKPVAAMGALRLVEQGRLGLDEDVNAKLASWKLPPHEFDGASAVTLRGLLTHSAGLTVHGFRGYAAGEPVPPIVHILEGAKPANSAPVRVDIAPGTRWRYSGGGYTVLQLLVEDATGQPFADYMREAVLAPLGMRDSTYEQPLPEPLQARAATGFRADGSEVPGKWHTYPEQAAAGLWTTPSDLLRFAIELQEAYTGRSNKVISPQMAQQMLSVQFENWGLGAQVSGAGETLRFSHSGGNEGFRCFLTAYVTRGQGAAVMTNSDAGAALYHEILRSIAAEYNWPDFRPETRQVVELPPARLRKFAGRYRTAQGPDFSVSLETGRLMIERPGEPAAELLPESETQFFTLDGATVRFLLDRPGRATGLEVGRGGRILAAQKIR